MACDTTLLFQLSTAREALPVQGARITVTDPTNGETHTLTTDSSGRTAALCVTAPPVDWSLVPDSAELPYSTYNALVEAEGYLSVEITGIQVFSGQQSLQPVEMNPAPGGEVALARSGVTPTEEIDIPPNGLRLVREQAPQGFPGDIMTLSRVFVPTYITVHLGAPSNTAARNVTVSFRDYIKNVASSEIYPTWPENALRANILAQITFAQNRIFTEWYPSQGYNFNITNNTNYDQYFVYGRNIFTNISRIVDEIYDQYIRRQGVLNPLFAQYCNGTTVTCEGLSQWGTVSLANNGYTPLGILRYYYGSDIQLATASEQRPISSSYPGSPLRVGSTGEAVRTLETQLNRIRRNYPAIPAISNVDTTFTAETQAAVRAFQRIFNLTPDGIVGPATWNKIAYIYAAVLRLAQLGSEDIPLPSERPSNLLRQGSTGSEVRLAQYLLRVISVYYQQVPPIEIDGIFGPATENAVRAFQRMQGLSADGIIGPLTWEALYDVFLGIAETTGLGVAYPGTPLRSGSRGDNVLLIQDYLNTIARAYPLPLITADGIFGPATENAVRAFQRLFGLTEDGIVGPRTWERIVAVRLLLR